MQLSRIGPGLGGFTVGGAVGLLGIVLDRAFELHPAAGVGCALVWVLATYPVWGRWWLQQHMAFEATRTEHLETRIAARQRRTELKEIARRSRRSLRVRARGDPTSRRPVS